MSLNVRPVSLEMILPLRQKVLRPTLALADCHMPIDDHPQVIHLAAIEQRGSECEQVLGICSIAPESLASAPAKNAWRLRSMATEPASRNQGVGKQLLLAAEQIARERSADCLWCHARLGAVNFYRRQGYRSQGQEFEVAGIGPHIFMIRDL